VKGSTTFSVFLDAGVPVSVADVFTKNRHTVILYDQVLMEQADDRLVCSTALANTAVLAVVNRDFNQLAKRYGVTPTGDRFEDLSIIRFGCNEVLASKRLEQAMPLIQLEWQYTSAKKARRMWIDIGPHWIRTHR
jgi:predicted nuclease of predicted toxin-antitoxin system